MAFKMQGAVSLPFDQQTVWAKLNDPDILKQSIPGCQALKKTSDTSFSATVRVKIGPVSTTFEGAVTLSDMDPPRSYRIGGSGSAGLAGMASGGASVLVEPVGDGCTLIYDVDATIGGKIAQLGSRLIDGVAKKLAEQFFANFAQAIAVPIPDHPM
jgi:uncharacterized protein